MRKLIIVALLATGALLLPVGASAERLAGSGHGGAPFTARRSRRPWFACTRTPTVNPPCSASTTREAVPMPPLNPWQIIPVPPPTLPSATGPSEAESSARWTCWRLRIRRRTRCSAS